MKTDTFFDVVVVFRYLREVGFPDNVLEARMARISAYKSLYNQNQLMEGGPSLRSVSPKPSVSLCMCVCVGL